MPSTVTTEGRIMIPFHRYRHEWDPPSSTQGWMALWVPNISACELISFINALFILRFAEDRLLLKRPAMPESVWIDWSRWARQIPGVAEGSDLEKWELWAETDTEGWSRGCRSGCSPGCLDPRNVNSSGERKKAGCPVQPVPLSEASSLSIWRKFA